MKEKLILTIASLVFTILTLAQQEITLVIDPGHGGTDPGNLNSKAEFKQEKDLTLAIAKKFGNYVDMYLGHKVKIIYTRTKDEFIALEDRIKLANDKNANYFISIHCNASDNPLVHGTETHIHNLNSKTSLKLAHKIENQFKYRAARNSRGVKQKSDRLMNLMVLKYSKMPAVLVETGFMTNPDEEVFLNSDRGQDLIASAIFRSFRDFIKEKHKIEMRTPPTEEEVVAKTVWKIQVMASTGPVALDNPDFVSTGLTVEELKIENANSPFNYKYYVGSFEDKKDAKEELKKVRAGVFKDAFLVKFE